MSRRDAIRLTAGETAEFLAAQRTMVCATNGRSGWPHLMPLWYVMRDQTPWAWTYARSQKVRNLERDPRASLQIEAGESYDELRGVLLECRVTIHRDIAAVTRLGLELLERYGGADAPPSAVAAIRAQAAKRVALQFTIHRTASWDHRKLAAAG
jgi:PPOX class probable F420-dependent enzyme